MNAQLVERLEKMHRMLAKTHEEIRELRIEVNTLHQALSSGDDIPAPMDNKQSPMEEELSILSAKNIKVGSKELLRILQISETTLKRWRKNSELHFEYLSRNHVVYPLVNIYEGIWNGQMTCKGLDRIKALERIRMYSSNASMLSFDD